VLGLEGARVRRAWRAKSRYRFEVLASALLVALAGASASASDGHVVNVGATVLSKNVCRFTDGGPTALSFGDIDPSSATAKTVAVTTGFRCTGSDKNATYLITSDDGLNESGSAAPRMRHASDPGAYLPYSLAYPETGTVARNVVHTMTFSATVQPADFQNALAGAYTDTVTLTILP